MHRVISIAALLLAFSVAPAHADRCDLMAKQIAAKVGLKTGKRTPANIQLQPLDPDRARREYYRNGGAGLF